MFFTLNCLGSHADAAHMDIWVCVCMSLMPTFILSDSIETMRPSMQAMGSYIEKPNLPVIEFMHGGIVLLVLAGCIAQKRAATHRTFFSQW